MEGAWSQRSDTTITSSRIVASTAHAPTTSSSIDVCDSGCLVHGSWFRVESSRFTMSGLGFASAALAACNFYESWFAVSGFEFRVSGFGFRVLDFGFRVSGFEFRVSGLGLSFSGFGSRVELFGFRVSGLGFRVSGFRFRVPGFRSRISGVGFRGSGFACRGCLRHRRRAFPWNEATCQLKDIWRRKLA